jgi:hypothetical protein
MRTKPKLLLLFGFMILMAGAFILGYQETVREMASYQVVYVLGE